MKNSLHPKQLCALMGILVSLSIPMSLVHASEPKADTNIEIMDPGTVSEQTERVARFDRNPQGCMTTILNLQAQGFQKTAWRLAKLYEDSGVSNYALHSFIQSQNTKKLKDR